MSSSLAGWLGVKTFVLSHPVIVDIVFSFFSIIKMPAECHTCGRYFDFGNDKMDANSLRQHMQVFIIFKPIL